jgi:hypothetical protein
MTTGAEKMDALLGAVGSRTSCLDRLTDTWRPERRPRARPEDLSACGQTPLAATGCARRAKVQRMMVPCPS